MGRLKGSKTGQYTLLAFTCERCGKPFTRKPSDAGHARFCSMACYKPPAAKVTCETCGTVYVPHPSERGRFCSNACKQRRVEKTCPHCLTTFTIKVSKASRFTYCSLACRRAAMPPVTLSCRACQQPFTVSATRGAVALYCSRACAKADKREMLTTIDCAYCAASKTLPRSRVLREGTRCCSNRCATLLRMRDGWNPGAFGIKLLTGHRTDIEALTEQVLIALGVPYLFEHKVSRYSVDFALPTLGIALECDGWQHRTATGRERDARRDAVLEAEGWQVVHIPDDAIRQNAHTTVTAALHL